MRENNKRTTKHTRKKGKIIIICILSVFLLTAAVTAVVNLSVLKLVLSPDKIVVSERAESIAALNQLESSGDVRNVEVSNDMKSVSFSTADESIKVSSEYDGERLKNISGEAEIGRIKVSSVDEARELVRVILSPYFKDAEIAAIFLRYSPDIIAGVRSGDIDMSFDIGTGYQVKIKGTSYGRSEFSITAK